MTRTILKLTTNVDRTGRRKEQIRWPQVDERRNGDDGRRFGDMAVDPRTREQIDFDEGKATDEGAPYSWADAPRSGFL